MNRLGDDLTELILSFLTFEEKIRFECVSKRWQRLIFNKQLAIGLIAEFLRYGRRPDSLDKLVTDSERYNKRKTGYRSRIDLKSLKSVLKKCPNITKAVLEVDTNGKEVSLIGQHCQRLTAIELDPIAFNAKILLDFGRKRGHQLTEIKFLGSCFDKQHDTIRDFLRLCPNVKKVYFRLCINPRVGEIDIFVNNGNEFLPKLEDIGDLRVRPNEMKNFEVFAHQFSRTMQKLSIEMFGLSVAQLKTCLTLISTFKNLESLKVSASKYLNPKQIEEKSNETIDESLSKIVSNCPHLKKLHLTINYKSMVANRLMSVLSELKSATDLNLWLSNQIPKLDETIECLKNCQELKRFEIFATDLTEDFFANIHTVLPKIRFLSISCSKPISKSFIASLQSMEYLQTILVSDDKRVQYCFGKYLKKVKDQKNVRILSKNVGLILDK